MNISTLCTAPILLAMALTLTACGEVEPEVSEASEATEVSEAPVAQSCNDCGTISNVEQRTAKGEATGVGAVVGAVAGAVVGHQFGSGSGNDAATAAGAIGGGFAGHEIEKLAKGTVYYHVTVAMESGGTRSVDVPALNGMSSGSKVKVVGNGLQLSGA